MDARDDCGSRDRCREKGQDVCGSAGSSKDIMDIQTPIPVCLLWIPGISDAYGMGEETHVPDGADGVLENSCEKGRIGDGLTIEGVRNVNLFPILHKYRLHLRTFTF